MYVENNNINDMLFFKLLKASGAEYNGNANLIFITRDNLGILSDVEGIDCEDCSECCIMDNKHNILSHLKIEYNNDELVDEDGDKICPINFIEKKLNISREEFVFNIAPEKIIKNIKNNLDFSVKLNV